VTRTRTEEPFPPDELPLLPDDDPELPEDEPELPPPEDEPDPLDEELPPELPDEEPLPEPPEDELDEPPVPLDDECPPLDEELPEDELLAPKVPPSSEPLFCEGSVELVLQPAVPPERSTATEPRETQEASAVPRNLVIGCVASQPQCQRPPEMAHDPEMLSLRDRIALDPRSRRRGATPSVTGGDRAGPDRGHQRGARICGRSSCDCVSKPFRCTERTASVTRAACSFSAPVSPHRPRPERAFRSRAKARSRRGSSASRRRPRAAPTCEASPHCCRS
jgi:hypothetical protein